MAVTENEFTTRDIKAWREGDWVMVSLAGEVIYRRLTRDRSFTHAEVIFAENQSPLHPKTRGNLRGAHLVGDWGSRRYRGPRVSNRLRVQITHDPTNPGDDHEIRD